MHPYISLACALVLLLTEAGCASRQSTKQGSSSPEFPVPPDALKQTEVVPGDYARPFGKPPIKADLAAAFLSLPDALAADMPVEMRRKYIAEYADKSYHRMFDAEHQFAEYYSDNPYNPIQPSSIFYLKILPSSKYHYVFVVSMLKQYSKEKGPRSGNFFVLAPTEAGWVDVTADVLPTEVRRNWYVQPLRKTSGMQAGPPALRADTGWQIGAREVDLLWKQSHFVARHPASSEFIND